jgi:sugar phosphate permease
MNLIQDSENSTLIEVEKGRNYSNELVGNSPETDFIIMEKENLLSYENISLGILLLIFTHSQLCRQIMYYFSDFSFDAKPTYAMNADLHFNKEEYATLASYGFTLFFVLASLLAGAFSDRYNRPMIIVISCFSWSILTLLQGYVGLFSELLILRAGIGISQAFLNPAAYSIISEIFPSTYVGTANSIYSTGIYLGGGMASLSIQLDQLLGWRKSLITMGILGIVLAIIAKFYLRDPRTILFSLRSTTNSNNNANNINNNNTNPLSSISLKDNLRDIVEIMKDRQVQFLLLASTFRFFAGFTISIWKAPFIFNKFPHHSNEFAHYNAIVITIGGLISSLLGGYLSDYLHHSRRNFPLARTWIPAVSSFLAIPFWWIFLKHSSLTWSLIALFWEYFFAECWIGPTLTALLGAIPKSKKGFVQGIFAFLTAIGNFGPLIMPWLIHGNYFSMEDALLMMVGLSYFISGLIFLAAANEEQKILDSSNY